MKQIRKIISMVSILMLIFNLFSISSFAAKQKSPYDYSDAPTRAIYYKSPVMTGKDVKWVQQALNIYGNYKLVIDGSFGPASKAATKKFQKSMNLTQDGSFGPKTKAAMVDWLNKNGYKKPSNPTPKPVTIKKKNYLQVDSKWSMKKYRNSYLRDSGCGILSIVNAVYNSTGNFIEPTTVADWAYNAKYFNQAKKGGGICNNDVFKKAAEKFGSKYGFKYTGTGSDLNSSTLKNHIKNGGTAIVHVPGHYMCLVEYNSSTGKYLVFDSAPGSGTSYNSIKRRNLTSPNGDWKTIKQLSTGNLKVSGYWMYAKK